MSVEDKLAWLRYTIQRFAQAVRRYRCSMKPEPEIYRRAIVRAVTGRPGVLHTEFCATSLADLCEALARAEHATSILRHLGYGKTGMWVDEIAATAPVKI